MNEYSNQGPEQVVEYGGGELSPTAGIIHLTGELKPGAVITEEGMGKLFNRCPTSIKRAVERQELPPPIRLFGANAWTAGVLVAHLEKRLEKAAKERERQARKISALHP